MAPRKGKKNSKSNVEQPQAEGQRPVGCSPRFAHADSKAKDTAKTTLDSLKETTREMVIRELEANPATRDIVKDKERLDKVVDECLRDSRKNSEKKIANISYKVMDRACTNAVQRLVSGKSGEPERIHTPFSAADDKTLKELDVKTFCIGPLKDKHISDLTSLVSRITTPDTAGPTRSEPSRVPDNNRPLDGDGGEREPESNLAEGNSGHPRQSRRLFEQNNTEYLTKVVDIVWKREGDSLSKNIDYVLCHFGQSPEARSRMLIDILVVFSGRICKEEFDRSAFHFLELTVDDGTLNDSKPGGPVEVPSIFRGRILSLTGRLDYATVAGDGVTSGLIASSQPSLIKVNNLAELRDALAEKLPRNAKINFWILEASKRLMSSKELDAHLPQVIAQTVAVMKATELKRIPWVLTDGLNYIYGITVVDQGRYKCYHFECYSISSSSGTVVDIDLLKHTSAMLSCWTAAAPERLAMNITSWARAAKESNRHNQKG